MVRTPRPKPSRVKVREHANGCASKDCYFIGSVVIQSNDFASFS
jgi:hypothetical protein